MAKTQNIFNFWEKLEYFKVPRLLLKDEYSGNLDANSLLIYMVMFSFSDEKGKMFPGSKLLSKKTHLSERSVYRAVQRLEENGFLSVTRREESGVRYNIYDVLRPENWKKREVIGDSQSPNIKKNKVTHSHLKSTLGDSQSPSYVTHSHPNKHNWKEPSFQDGATASHPTPQDRNIPLELSSLLDKPEKTLKEQYEEYKVSVPVKIAYTKMLKDFVNLGGSLNSTKKMNGINLHYLIKKRIIPDFERWKMWEQTSDNRPRLPTDSELIKAFEQILGVIDRDPFHKERAIDFYYIYSQYHNILKTNS